MLIIAVYVYVIKIFFQLVLATDMALTAFIHVLTVILTNVILSMGSAWMDALVADMALSAESGQASSICKECVR